MGLLRLCVCVSGVYAAFLLWAIAQERLSQPFQAQPPHAHTPPPHAGDKFPSPLFFNFSQALASASAAAIYLLVDGWRSGALRVQGVAGVLGLSRLFGASKTVIDQITTDDKKTNGDLTARANSSVRTNGHTVTPPRPWYQTLPALLLQVSLFQTTAGPIGFHALKHISYPTMVLAKSCKLIPVLLLNVLLYRRRFGAHKYAVVLFVSAGISMFMLFGSKKKGGGGDSVFGMSLLLVNLLIDGLTNSTQDQIFALYPGYSGQQMMFIMAFLQLCLLTPAMLLPLPANPFGQLATFVSPGMDRTAKVAASQLLSSFAPPILLQSIRFLLTHPSAMSPLAAYAALGGLGQIFIFETIAHFGSLTLVMVTVTRKLFTMLLSVFVFGHTLSPGQWAGVAVVFAGIGLEAGFKRREAKRRVQRDNVKSRKTQ